MRKLVLAIFLMAVCVTTVDAAGKPQPKKTVKKPQQRAYWVRLPDGTMYFHNIQGRVGYPQGQGPGGMFQYNGVMGPSGQTFMQAQPIFLDF